MPPQPEWRRSGTSEVKSTVANTVSRYYVTIGGLTNAVFSEVSGLQMETELFEYQEGGNNAFTYKFPVGTKVGNITLKRGVAKDNSLFKWYMRVANGMMDLREVTIVLYTTQDSEKILTWTFTDCYPCKWSGPQLAAGTDSTAIETLELAHMGEIKIS